MIFPFYAQSDKELIDACNLCGSHLLSLQNVTDRYGLEAPSVECKECGLVQLSLRMTPEAYREFYAEGHYRELLSLFYGCPITAATIEAEQKVYADRLAQWLLPHMGPALDGLLLDLGGSTGVVAWELAQYFNLDATVVEPACQEAERARNRGVSVANVPLQEYEAGGNHYDLVTLCQTVDHLLDIRADLGRIRGWVKPGGLFFMDFVENGPVKIDHPFYLTQTTARAYLEGAGYTVKAMEPAGNGLHVNILCGVA